ncbi:hypothetical protein [Kribbella monticola]|uniref:hypothetical protein n=1 Tax=Kribbella monticola TaxID=2185285 RepID=UPI001300598D|nr:hypothetical protein [Kribbella monticola]
MCPTALHPADLIGSPSFTPQSSLVDNHTGGNANQHGRRGAHYDADPQVAVPGG